MRRALFLALIVGTGVVAGGCAHRELEAISPASEGIELADEEISSADAETFAHIAAEAKVRGDERKLSEEGFCKDDIYTSYLSAQYLANKRGKERLKERRPQRRTRTRNLRKQEQKALHFAASRLSPRSAVYVGSIPVVVTADVEFWLGYFKNQGRHTFIKWLVRGEAIKPTLLPLLAKEGMPAELIYLSMIESGFNNQAYSHARATGPWQFVAGTAKMYGLQINYWLDERNDPIKSTLAAATYLRDLYTRFGDWYLAMAAYNAGPGRVAAAIRRAGSRDFWELARYLSLETQQYVPKLLAALLLGAHSTAHGFNVKPYPSDEFPKQTVLVKQPVRLDEVAQLLHLPSKLLRRWNPELRQGMTPPARWWSNGKGYPLRLPQPYVAKFVGIEPQLSHIEIKDVHMHKVRRGDTLTQIARRYKIPVQQIMRVNPRLSAKRLGIGKEIAIPVPSIVMQKRKGEIVPTA